ncbi:MAG: ribonuclease P protein component [bacterium]|nr:ribonuclease P protein component [bacterium]
MMQIHRIGREQDFTELFRFGRKKEYRFFRLTLRPHNLAFSRFAFIAPKTVDKRAVVRNRLRRRTREWIRRNIDSLPRSFDVALFFKKEAKSATRKEFYEDLTIIFQDIAKYR